MKNAEIIARIRTIESLLGSLLAELEQDKPTEQVKVKPIDYKPIEKSNTYNLVNIRQLLNNGFQAEGLKRFCSDYSQFNPVNDALMGLSGKATIIDKLMEYCEIKDLFDVLLTWCQIENIAKFNRHKPYS